MTKVSIIIVVALAIGSLAQRSPYAGRRPIGYPALDTTTTTESELGNRFGDDGNPTTTQKLPLEARGDREYINKLSKLPLDQQPFWFINWQALDQNRQKPQTYPLKPNVFVDNSGIPNSQQPWDNRNSLTNSAPNSQLFSNLQNSFINSAPTLPSRNSQNGIFNSTPFQPSINSQNSFANSVPNFQSSSNLAPHLQPFGQYQNSFTNSAPNSKIAVNPQNNSINLADYQPSRNPE